MTSQPRSTDGSGLSELPPAPAVAQELLGARLPAMEHYAVILATRGVDHGLIGPREVPRLWGRHIVNCLLLADIIPDDVRVIDVGSGAGLPGLVLAVARPDLRVDLVEPLERRVRWLEPASSELGLDSVEVHRGKAEAFWGSLTGDVVTARAVARLSELAGWCLPLVHVGGGLLAMKGATAAREIQQDRAAMEAAGAGQIEVVTLGEGLVEVPTRVVSAVRAREATDGARRRSRRGKPGGGGGSPDQHATAARARHGHERRRSDGRD